MGTMGLLHVAAALAALGLGLAILRTRKGTPRHRRHGRLFVLAMVAVNGAALTIYREGTPSVFHALALVSLATLSAGFWAIRRKPGLPGQVAHGTLMSWALAGLLAAGLGQGAAALGVSVAGTVLGTLAVAAVLIHTRDMAGIARKADP